MKLFSLRILLNTAAALSLLLSASSCAKVSIDSSGQTERYIGFTSAVETKASPVESSDDMAEFAVWAAYYADGSLDDVPMRGIKVYRDNLGAWMYDDLQLWQEGYWHFEAFYPHPSVLAVSEIVEGKDAMGITFTAPKTEEQTGLEGLTIEYYYGPTASHDLMTDEYTRSYTAASPDASPVQFTFEHLLSRVGIAVKSTSKDVTLTSLVFKGMSVLGAYNTPESQGQWRLLTSIPELSNVQPGSFTADRSDISAPLPSDGTAVDVLSDLLLIPQTPGDSESGLTPIVVEVSYTMGEAAPETRTLTLPSSTPWQPGRHYRYTITLGGSDVNLTVNIVDWNELSYSVEF